MPETTEQKEPQKEVVQHATDPRDERIKALEAKVHALTRDAHIKAIHSKWAGFSKNDVSDDFLDGVEYAITNWKPDTIQHSVAKTEPVNVRQGHKPGQAIDEDELATNGKSDL